jgi:hypothetical protein
MPLSFSIKNQRINRKGDNLMTTIRTGLTEIERLQNSTDGENGQAYFPVCTTHKSDFFADYALARVRKKEQCVLCHPRSNDSLGG